ncbi:MAG: pro-sigmaK processing inhibitor BofA family protein [Christensenellales bacterium]
MDFPVRIDAVLSYVFALVLLYLCGWLLLKPFKVLLKWLLNALLGGIALLVLNFFGSPLHIYLPVNPLNAAVVGFLGIPGVILLLVLQIILK